MKMRLLKRLKCTQKFEKLAWTSGATSWPAWTKLAVAVCLGRGGGGGNS